MPGIGEVEFPKGKLSFSYPRKGEECWSYAHSRCSLHMAFRLERRDVSGVGYGNFQDTPESAMGAKALAPVLDFISLFPYKSKLRERRLFFFS